MTAEPHDREREEEDRDDFDAAWEGADDSEEWYQDDSDDWTRWDD